MNAAEVGHARANVSARSAVRTVTRAVVHTWLERIAQKIGLISGTSDTSKTLTGE